MIFFQAKPHPSLEKYIEFYTYHSMNTSMLPSLKQTFLPYDRPGISFFIGPVKLQHDREYLTGPISAANTQSAFAYLNALTTTCNSFYFKENARVQVIIIQFKAYGFSALFPNNMEAFTNQLPDFSLLTGATECALFLEQLLEARNFTEQVVVMDKFFITRLNKVKQDHAQIREACRRLIITDGLTNMKQLAYLTNMSLRTLERKFTEQVGVPPKMFARFKRFHHALSLMQQAADFSLKEIVYECGYYDHAHFTKEFQTFSNKPPSTYFTPEFFLYNQFMVNRNFSPD